MIGLALSGGGSRAIAFHLGCLRALDDLELLDRIDVLSTISGGSVIGAYYAYMPNKSFPEFEDDIRRFLRRGFQRAIIARLLKPRNLARSARNLLAANFDLIAERLARRPPRFRGYPARTDIFKEVLEQAVFPGLTMRSPRRRFEVVVGACDLRTGSAFRFGNAKSGSWRLGNLVNSDVELSLAVAASAAYPLLLSTLDREWKFEKNGIENTHKIQLTDGGIYDNLGIQVIEPRRDPSISVHTFSCKYLIVCNAGHGQPPSTAVPARLVPRLSSSFTVVHRRVQDAAMQRLHNLREANIIKGFALPYLGQLDESLPWKPSPLVRRTEVIDYPTDFGAMPNHWIERLSARGEQLTRTLVSAHLQQLLET
jgi:NTE family protein